MRTDLHIHTTASDGCWSPEQLVAEVKARAIGLFAVADHDTIESVGPAEALACEEGLAFLRGVEVSTRLDSKLFHVLAYGFEQDAPTLEALLCENRVKMEKANEAFIQHMIAAGYPIDPEDYAGYQHVAGRGGWKTFNFLVDRGFCTHIGDYFNLIPIEKPSQAAPFPHPAEAIAAIREAGGVPILAHPGASLHDGDITDEALQPFLDFGIAGLECYSQYHDEDRTRFCLDWCARHGLSTTGGSDCHGGFVKRELGIPIVDTADLRLHNLAERIVCQGEVMR